MMVFLFVQGCVKVECVGCKRLCFFLFCPCFVDVNMFVLYVVGAKYIHIVFVIGMERCPKKILGWVNPADVGCIPTLGASKRKDGKQVTGNFFET